MKICKKCGTECHDGNIFCEKCGAELDIDILPDNIDDKGNVKTTKPKEAPKPRAPKEKIKLTEAQREARLRTIRGCVIVLAAVAIIALVAFLISFIGNSKGYNAALKVPLGRNVEFAQSETGLTFSSKSSNGMINSMADFDYVCVSEKNVKVNGSEQPEWAIMLTVDDQGMISTVEYYDFTQLKLNWQGRKMAEMLTDQSLTYGMSIKNVNKTLGMSPYYIKRNVSNDSIYCYRYHFTDETAGYDRAYNYYVGFSDTDMSVKSVSFREIDYARVILNANNSGMYSSFSSNDRQSLVTDEEDSDDSEESAETDETSEEDTDSEE